jgi:hypothetical protein
MNAAPVWITLFIVIVVGMAVLAIIGAVVWLLVRRPRGGDPSLMACGACGYSVRGVQTTACPECGADLREAGIARRGGSNRVALGIAAGVAALALLLGCACLGGWFFFGVAPSRTVVTTPAMQGTAEGDEIPETTQPADDNAKVQE